MCRRSEYFRPPGNIFNISLWQARDRKDLGKELSSELPKLEEAIESKQFVAHANSILETESATEKVGQDWLVIILYFNISISQMANTVAICSVVL